MKNVYLIGIGGIGMSALARYYHHAGYSVSGYDRTESRLTKALEGEGISIHYEDRPDLVPAADDTLVIYTPAIPSQMKELRKVIDAGYHLVKRSKALGEIASTQKCLAVAGTHGKTTTSTLLAHILTDSGEGCTAFLGGISKNYHTNLLLSKNQVLVAEADEFDRSFLQLYPQIAVITSIDADHLDIYSDYCHVKEAFNAFATQVKEHLIVKKGLESFLFNCTNLYTYSYDKPCDFYASDILPIENGSFTFTLNTPKEKIENCILGIPGWVNIENAVAAGAVAYIHGVPSAKIRKAFASFAGVERRFDVRFKSGYCTYIDDYAHHPNELSAAISSIRTTYPSRKICGIFQPHLYTRTRDFHVEFAKSLSMLDKLLLLPIYPAREEPIEGVDSRIIFDLVTISDKKIISKEEIFTELDASDIDILVTFGAGDIDRLTAPIAEYLKERFK